MSPKKTRKIVLITWEKLSRESLSRELKELLVQIDPSIEFHTRSMDDLGEKIFADLYLVSTVRAVETIKQIWGLVDVPVLACRRTVDHNRIKPLLKLPDGTSVLLVIEYDQDAIELQMTFEGVGINHLRFIPWKPGNPVPPQILFAVTTGKPQLIPEEITNMIDIGTRTIDITTIIEMLYHMQLLDQPINKVSIRFIKQLVDLYRELLKEEIELRTNRTMLQEIFNESLEGIALINENGTIAVNNHKFSEYTSELGFKNASLSSEHENVFKWLAISSDTRSHILKGTRIQLLVSVKKLTWENGIKYLIFLRDVTEIKRLQQEVYDKLAEQGHIAKNTMENVISTSSRMKETIKLAEKISQTNGTVLLLGESGVGKELFAQAIHNASERAGRPFVAVNFSSLSESLMESELFGYEEGAFTGARKGGKSGLFEVANGGTIFLDEIGDASLAIQLRLLRIIQERQLMRVGGTRIRNIDVRLIAATHRNLIQCVKEGTFRQDLYYRLAVFLLELPPLRERTEDIYPLFLSFFSDVNQFKIDPQMEGWLRSYSWPGNIRELQNCVLYIEGTAEKEIGFQNLPPTIKKDLLFNQNIMNMTNTEPKEKEEASSDFMLLETSPIYKEILAHLEKNQQTTGQGIGRSALSQLITSIPLTAAQLRSRLHVLQKMGMIQASKGRRGTIITKRGQDYIRNLLIYD